MKYFKKLEGEKVYLSPINPDDYEIYTKWLNDPDVTKYLTCHNKLVSLLGEKEFLEKFSCEEFNFGIINKNDDTLLGNIGLNDINYKDGTASLGIFIGECNTFNKGYGTDAIKLIINFAFNELRLHNIRLDVLEFNERAIHVYEKCGFKEYGRRHEAMYRDGKYIDLIEMEIIK